MHTKDVIINLVPVPQGERGIGANQGETLHFRSPHGTVRVEFETPPGPVRQDTEGTEVVINAAKGRFPFRCGILTPAGEKYGWPDEDSPNGGGEVIVPRRG